jgi:flagellar basal body-associated protein FliL
MYSCRMPFREKNDNSRIPRLRQRKTLLIIAAIAAIIIAPTVFVLVFFFMDENNETGNTNTNTNYLPPNCYSINGEIICPKK